MVKVPFLGLRLVVKARVKAGVRLVVKVCG